MKKRTKKYNPRNHSKSLHSVELALHRSSHQETDNKDAELIVMPIYAAITVLMAGKLALDDFVRLNEMNMFGFELAKSIHDKGDDDTQKVIAPSQAVFETAADALALIGDRWNKTGKFVSTGDEITSLRAMASWIDQLCNVASRGMVLAALIEAKSAVEKFFGKQQKAA